MSYQQTFTLAQTSTTVSAQDFFDRCRREGNTMGFQLAMACTHDLACSSPASRGKCRRNSTMAASSPSPSKAWRIALAAAGSTVNMLASSTYPLWRGPDHAYATACVAPGSVRNKQVTKWLCHEVTAGGLAYPTTSLTRGAVACSGDHRHHHSVEVIQMHVSGQSFQSGKSG